MIALEFVEHGAAAMPGSGKIGIYRQSLVIGGQCFIIALEFVEHIAAAVPGFSQIGFEHQRPVDRRQRLVVALEAEQNYAAAEPALGKIRHQRQEFLDACQRRIVTAQIRQKLRPHQVDLREIRFEGENPIEACNRVVGAPGRKLRHPKAVPRLDRLRGYRQGSIVAGHSVAVASEPAEYHAKQIKRREVPRLGANHGLQELLGLFEIAGLERRNAALEILVTGPDHRGVSPERCPLLICLATCRALPRDGKSCPQLHDSQQEMR